MTSHWLRSNLVSSGIALATLAITWACADRATTGPENPAIEQAPGSTSDGSPQITATDPDTGFRNTTIDVQVLGSGFDQGSKATWALDGDTTFATTKIKTNSTRYVTPKKLIANITIGPDSPLELYDVVVVTLAGKKGIGLERFAVTYQLIDLGTLGGARSEARGLNELGHVVGVSETATGKFHAFLWTRESGMRDIGFISDNWPLWTGAFDINDQGQVVGARTPGTRAFVWTSTEGLRELDRAGADWSSAYAINEAGEIGGEIQGLPGGARASVVWSAAGTEIVDNTVWPYIYDLNESGSAVGWTDDGPFLYTRNASGWTKFEIPGAEFGGQARGLNTQGQVTGMFRGADAIQGFVWSAAEGLKTLPALVPGGRVDPYDINDSGIVVGWVLANDPGGRPALWMPSGLGTWKLHLLPSGSRNTGFAYGINNRGDAVGTVRTRDSYHAALWTVR